jgi:membrane associated rhomboid family serine protease
MHQGWNAFGVYKAMGTIVPYASGMDLTIGVEQILYTPVVGASGALFGVLGGFAMLFPNTELMLILFSSTH